MDKQAFIGIFLIMIVTLVWMFTMEPQRPGQTDLLVDSTLVQQPAQQADNPASIPEPSQEPAVPPTLTESLPQSGTTTPHGSIVPDSTEKVIHIENEFIRATISSQNGGRLTSWILKKYDFYLGGQVDMIAGHGTPNVDSRGLNIEFVDVDGKTVKLADFNLSTNMAHNSSIYLDENNQTTEIEFYLPINNGRIVKRFIFDHNRYSADVLVGFENLNDFIGSRWYTIKWENGLPATEENMSEDFEYFRAYTYLGGEVENLDVSDGENEKMEKSGRVDWSALRSKYFLAAIVPHETENLSTTLAGIGYEKDDMLMKVYDVSLGVNFPNIRSTSNVDSFTLYLGPLAINELEPYGVNLEDLVMNSSGYESFFRPISRWIVLPAFNFLHGFIPNYGWVIVVFSVLVKILLHPLTKKSYQSMGGMQTLQPKMTELREKYKNEPQRLNKEMMKLYKEEGINPLGGCLPMLLQMPLLFALFIVFRSTIQLRGEPFIGWITDLSRPDSLPMGFELPFIGDTIHVLPFLMGITMIWQSKMTMTDPKQKPMMMIMPVFMTFIFYSFPSGLNLYYSIFNVLSMAQTRMIKKKPAENGKVDNKVVAKSAKTAKNSKQAKKPSTFRDAIAQMSQEQKPKKKKKRSR